MAAARRQPPVPGAAARPPVGGAAPLDPDRDAAARAALVAARDHAVLAAALDPILTIDAHGIIQSASDSVHRVFGWTPAELVGRNISVLMPEPHRSAHDGYLANYRRTGRTNILGRTREFECVRKGGERFPIDLSVSRVDPPGGGLPLFVGIIRDISERKRLERELRLVQDLALSISGASTLPAALTEATRLIALATGWDYGEIWEVSEDRAEIRPAAAWARPGSGLENFAATAQNRRHARGESLPGRAWAEGRPIWEHDVTALRDTGFYRREEAVAAGLRAAAALPIVSEGEVIAVLFFLVREARREDLHLIELVQAAVAPLGTLIQRKRAEQELAEYRRRLEEKVEERTAELSESREKLRMADRLASIGTLAAGLGHDMNNVLLPVRAHLNALRAEAARGEIAPSAARHVEAIHKSAAYLQQLADGLHYLAVDPDKEDASASATDLAVWWSQTGVLIAKAVPKHVRVKASIAPALPKVAVPAASLTQAVLNLVVNAGEAIPAGRKRVQGNVRISARAGDAAAVRLSVADNGTGMTDEVKRRAFELFFTTKSRGLGTGLGLALVRKVVEDAGGSIEIESRPGAGTTVSMDLPAAAAASPPAAAAPTAVISIADGRAAALVRLVLEAVGATTAAADEPDTADLWIVEPAPRALPAAQRWRTRRPGGRLVLFGAPADDAVQWRSLRPITIETPDDFEAVRSVIGHALRPQ